MLSYRPCAPLSTKANVVYYSMVNMFANCSSLTSLNLRNFKPNSLASNGVSSMFSNCSTLRTIYATDWATANSAINASANTFLDCRSLRGGISYSSSKTSGEYCKQSGGYFTA